MKFLRYILLISVVISCSKDKTTDIRSFRTGHFKTYLEEKKDSSTFYRTEKLQIELYKGKSDTFSIDWKSNFEYHLLKTNPKNRLDSLPFVVKIIGIKQNSYTFKGNYKGSNFVQKGSTFKINP